MRTPYRYAVPIQVRFRDTDGMGHVNNAVYATYLEIARTAYWIDVFGIRSYNEVDFVVARLEIDFVAPAFVHDELEVWIHACDAGTKSFRFTYEIVRLPGEETLARATSVQVMYDYATGRSKPLADAQRRRLEEFETGTGPALTPGPPGRRRPAPPGDR